MNRSSVLARVGATLLLAGVLGSLPACQKKLHYGAAEIVYEPDVGDAEAHGLGDYLEAHGYFAGGKPATVKMNRRKDLSHSPPTYRVILFTKDKAWDDASFVERIQTAANETKQSVFHGQQTIFVLAEQQGIEHKKVYAH